MEVTPAEAKALATSAYIFALPLVVSYGEMYVNAIDLSSRSRGGGFGSWLRERNATSDQSDMTSLDTTMLYSSTWVDLRSEPWVVLPPTIDATIDMECFDTCRVSDLWGFTIGEFAPGNQARSPALLASPTWVGEVPADVVRVICGESAFVHLESWIAIPDPAETDRIGSTRQVWLLEPLSAHLGRPAPEPAPALHWLSYHSGAETGDEFWSLANFALSLTTPHTQDREMFDRIAGLGVVAGRPWDESSLTPDVAEGISDGMDDALSELMRAAAEPLDPVLLYRSRVDTNRDYFSRALGALRRGPVDQSSGGMAAGNPDPRTRSVVDGDSP